MGISTLHFNSYTGNNLTTDQNPDTVSITFRATSLVDTDVLEIEEVQFIDGYVVDIHQMTLVDTASNIFEYTWELLPGTLLKYRYGLAWTNWETFDIHNAGAGSHYRTLIVPNSDTIIDETVYGYSSGVPNGATTYANVTGQIVDSVTGEGLSDGIVWIGGISSKISRNGSFYIDSTVAGYQRMTIFSFDHYPLTLNLSLTPPGSINNEIRLNPINVVPSPPIQVTFLVNVPDFPDTNHLRLIGDLPNLGAIYPYVADSRAPYLQHLTGSYYMTEVELHAGVPFTYMYSIGSVGINQEKGANEQNRFRKLVLNGDTVVQDTVEKWYPDLHYETDFVVQVPTSTPNETVYLSYGNVLTPMTKISDYTWKVKVYYFGYDTDFAYYYQLGEFPAIYAELDHWSNNPRHYTVKNGTVNDSIPQWRWLNQTQDNGSSSIDVTLQVNIPFDTPDGDLLYLVGDLFSNGWSNPTGQQLTRLEDHLYEANLTVSRSESYRLSVTRGDFSSLAINNFTLSGYYNHQLIHNYVEAWRDRSLSWNRTSFIGGVAIMDWWDPGLIYLVEPAFKRYAENGGEWIEFVPVWNIDHLKPSIHIGDQGGVPDEDLQYITELAHKYNLKMHMNFIMNAENTPDAEGVGLPAYDASEWEVFRHQFLEMVDHHTKLAQEYGIDMVGFPLYVGPNSTLYDALMNESIDLARENYMGKLTCSIGWSNIDFTFPAKLDYVGLYLWDDFLVGNDYPTTVELRNAIELRLDSTYKQFSDKFNKPIIISQFAYASTIGSNYERSLNFWYQEGPQPVFSQTIQARMYEAFLQAVANRTWIEGMFSFGYTYFPLEYPDYSIAYKQAEAVLLKWNSVFNKDVPLIITSKELLQDNFVLDLPTDFSELRYALPNSKDWSKWDQNNGSLDLKPLITPSNQGGGQFIIWVQGRNGLNESNPYSILLRVDKNMPQSGTWEEDIDFIKIRFEDDTKLTISYDISKDSSVLYSGMLTGNTFVYPKSVLPFGILSVNLQVEDEVGNIYTKSFTVNIPTHSSSDSNLSSTSSINSESTSGSSTTSTSKKKSDSGFISLDTQLIFSSLFVVIIAKSYIRSKFRN